MFLTATCRRPSFYTMFSLEPRRDNIIRLCDSPPCHLMGSKSLLDYLEETRSRFMLEVRRKDGRVHAGSATRSCLGACGVAPAMMLNEGDVRQSHTEKVDPSLTRGEKRYEPRKKPRTTISIDAGRSWRDQAWKTRCRRDWQTGSFG